MSENGTSTKQLDRGSVQGRAEEGRYQPQSVVNIPMMLPVLAASFYADHIQPYNPIYPGWRDNQLQEFARSEPLMASAVYTMKSRMATLKYHLNGPDAPKARAQRLLDDPGMGDSLPVLISKLADDLMTSDNGAFIEKIGPGNPSGPLTMNLVTGFAHLDSRQCWRTFDPEYPVIYTNPQTTKMHRLHYTRVVMLSDNPQPNELARNIGFCAVSRALRMAQYVRGIEQFKYEKITGRFTRAFGIVSGVTKNSFETAMNATEEEAAGRGWVIYKGIPFLLTSGMEAGKSIDAKMVDLAGVSDGFKFIEEMTTYAYILSACFGVDAREIWPATDSGATKADANVQNIKAQRRGIGYLTQAIQWGIRQCLPASAKFEFDVTDEEQERVQQEVKEIKTRNLNTFKVAGAINAVEMRAMGIAEGILDESVLENLDIPVTNDSDATTPEDDSAALEENPPGSDTETPPVDDEDDDAADQKAIKKKTQSAYYTALVNAAAALWDQDIDQIGFIARIDTVVTTNLTRAWQDGMKRFNIPPDAMSEDEQAALTREIQNQYSYVVGLALFITQARQNDGAFSAVESRLSTWASRYSQIETMAASMAAADQPAEWILGATEKHCETCSFYAGKVYRMSTWKKWLEPAGHMPGTIGGGLKCGGWNCDCGLVPTDKPMMKGRPALWRAA